MDITISTVKPGQKSVALITRGLRVEHTVVLNGYAVKLHLHIYDFHNLCLGQIRFFFQ